MSVQNGLVTGQGDKVKGPWGPQGSGLSETRSYSSITAINTSVRDNKNVLEVRLERQQGATFRLSQLEIESLLVRLGIDGSHFLGVSACPEGKPVVLITLHPSVDIKKFLYRNESYVVKEGVRTTAIRPAGKKDVLVTVSGLNPNIRDQAVIRYLEAHGKVSKTEKVIHHVFPGEYGSTLCAGKFNGNRSFVMEITEQMGSYHIIDGEKVTIRYPGQEWSCARCHNFKRSCPGLAIAKDCTAERVLLSSHMENHWRKIGFKPETKSDSEVDDVPDLDIQVGQPNKVTPVISESQLVSKYKSVIVKGFLPSTSLEDVCNELRKNGLPSNYNTENLLRNEKSGALTIPNLEPDQCLLILENMHSKKFLGRKIFVTSVVSNSPSKSQPSEESIPSSSNMATLVSAGKSLDSNSSSNELVCLSSSPVLDPKALTISSSKAQPQIMACTDEFEFDPPFDVDGSDRSIASFQLPNKRKAIESPELKEMTRKDKKAVKRELRKKNKSEEKTQRQLDISPSKS